MPARVLGRPDERRQLLLRERDRRGGDARLHGKARAAQPPGVTGDRVAGLAERAQVAVDRLPAGVEARGQLVHGRSSPVQQDPEDPEEAHDLPGTPGSGLGHRLG